VLASWMYLPRLVRRHPPNRSCPSERHSISAALSIRASIGDAFLDAFVDIRAMRGVEGLTAPGTEKLEEKHKVWWSGRFGQPHHCLTPRPNSSLASAPLFSSRISLISNFLWLAESFFTSSLKPKCSRDRWTLELCPP
jgi:hypothetical protein